jgi:hypothetical protein
MKYKYLLALAVFLAVGCTHAMEYAEDEAPHGRRSTGEAGGLIGVNAYQEIYSAFTCGGVANINAALKNNEGFNHNNDVDTIRRSAAGFALRTAVISLNAADLQTVVGINHDFFKTSLGVSLVYGWTLNQFKDAITPYYIGRYFSFEKMFQGLADRVEGDNVKTFLKSAFTRGLRAVEDDRWAFYDHMLYLPYAIEKVRAIEQVRAAVVDDEAAIDWTADDTMAAFPQPMDMVTTGACLSKARATDEERALARTPGTLSQLLPSMDIVIAYARRSTLEARTEVANLLHAPGKAMHLVDEASFENPQANWDANNFVGLQKITIQWAQHCRGIDRELLEIFQSLPADTDINAFTFMSESVVEHMETFRRAIVEAQTPTPTKKDTPKGPQPRRPVLSRILMVSGVVVAIIGVGLAMGGVKVTNLIQKCRGWWA